MHSHETELDIAIPALPPIAEGSALLAALRDIVGKRHVLTGEAETCRYTTGYRFGRGAVLAVIRPGTLVEQWRVLRACLAAQAIMIFQSANTGLTGGSTPDGIYEREVVLINTMRIRGIHVIQDGRQVVCLPGATLDMLERRLKPLGREPHSVIGSSCVGASVVGGVCNNSGGALIRRGPAYTEMALFAKVDDHGVLHLVNHLGIALGSDPETVLRRIETGAFDMADITSPPQRAASDHSYAAHVRDIDRPTPARFNADPSRLFEASGCAGKVMLLAVRLDTFPMEENTATFYIGSNNREEFTTLRRHVLGKFASLPISAEYLHRDAYDVAEAYGKDMFLAIRWLGTASIPTLMKAKAVLDAIGNRVPFLSANVGDRLLQRGARLLPAHLPSRMRSYRVRFEHHLILKMGGDGVEEARAYLSGIYPSVFGDYFECTAGEARDAFLHRFVAAGAAVRYRSLHWDEVEDIIALDIALRRDDRKWFEELPGDIASNIVKSLYYGHFFCHVFHQDYLVRKGADTSALEHRMLAILDERGAEYPAEHNVGHLYAAKPAMVDHFQALDPCNIFNPGIGQTSRAARWQ